MELALRMVSTSGPCKFGCAEEGGVVPLEFTTGSAHEMQPTKNPPQKGDLVALGQPLRCCLEMCFMLNSGAGALIWNVFSYL